MRKKWIFIAAISVVCILLTVVFSVLIFQLRHKHQLGDAKVYHIYNDHIYYTRQCVKDGHTQSFETDTTFAEVLEGVGAEDKIIVEEDILSAEIFKIKSFAPQLEVRSKDVVINIDLNNKKISSAFELIATYGTIKFNISNGTINTSYRHAFKLEGELGKIEVNINDVDCYSTGYKTSPLYVENVKEVSVNALDSKFVAKKDTDGGYNYGVGAFLNGVGDFNFENCLFEGGDGLHVKNGDVSLIGCNLVNNGLISQDYQSVSSGFSAVGASLAAHCYTDVEGTTDFKITVEDCVMTTNTSNTVMRVYKVAESGYDVVINPDSYILIKSCKFGEDPNTLDYLNKVIYEDGSTPVNNGLGYWVYGDMN